MEWKEGWVVEWKLFNLGLALREMMALRDRYPYRPWQSLQVLRKIFHLILQCPFKGFWMKYASSKSTHPFFSPQFNLPNTAELQLVITNTCGVVKCYIYLYSSVTDLLSPSQACLLHSSPLLSLCNLYLHPSEYTFLNWPHLYFSLRWQKGKVNNLYIYPEFVLLFTSAR